MGNLLTSLNTVQKGLLVAIVAMVLYISSASVSYTIFSSTAIFTSSGNTLSNLPGAVSDAEEDPKLPRTEPCPLDGELHTVHAREAWDQRRPLAVMIENHIESRPQSGLFSADVVYEAVAEGGITRFMALYLCNMGDAQVGPVRSARTYFLDWLSEYDALYAHVGGANMSGPANALGQIIDYNIKDLNQFNIGFPVFWRDYQRLGRSVAAEHTMYSTTRKLWETGEKKGWAATVSGSLVKGKNVGAGVRWDANFVPWKFTDVSDQAGVAGALQAASKIEVNFWESQSDYKVEWNFDVSCSCYKRKNAGVDHMDLNNNKQLSPRNVVVQFMSEGRANDGYEGNVHLLYTNKGQGRAVVFAGGKVIEGIWVKPTRLAREKFLDKNGQEIGFNRGQIWIQTVPEGSKVIY